MKQFLITLLLIAVCIGGYFAWKRYTAPPTEVPVAIETFSCEQGKTIGATLYREHVELVLSDGRKFSLAHVASETGERYRNADGSFVFEYKNNTAFISEGRGSDSSTTYTNCVTGGPLSSGQNTDELTTYSYPPLGFSIQYPKNYSLDQSYQYQGLIEEVIPGVKVSVSQALSDSTNLSPDSGVSIEYIPHVGAAECSASLFLYGMPPAQELSDGGIAYSVASSSSAGAGNFYEEIVYALSGQNPCLAVRYMIHFTQIANYPTGSKEEFDQKALFAQFDKIRHSLTLKNQL